MDDVRRQKGLVRIPMLFVFLLAITFADSDRAVRQIPTGIIFHKDTLYRSDARGDNWCITWAADNSQITSMCDGNWLKSKHSYHNHLYRIIGELDGFSITDIPNYPQFVSNTSWGSHLIAHQRRYGTV